MRAQEFVTDEINKQVFSPGWTDETTILNRYVLKARAADDWNKYQKLDIDVFDPEGEIPFRIAYARFRIKPGFFFQKNLEASMIYVSQEYQKRGIATAIYQYVRKLGNTIKPSKFQLPAGKSMWKSFDRTDALAEEFDGPTAAGCIVVAEDTGRWCLQQRSNTVSDPGVWSTWGGGSEPGETVTETVLRELAEESGYTGPVTLRLVDSSPSYATFMAVVPHEFEPRINSECQDWRWCEPDQLPEPLHPGLAQLISKNINEDVYDILKPHDCGPFDGGCVLVAQALQQIHGGRVVVLTDENDRAQHAAVLANGQLIDYDGTADPKEFVQQFEQNERVRIQGIRAIRDTDLPDAPRDAKLIPQIVQALSENSEPDTAPNIKLAILQQLQQMPLTVFGSAATRDVAQAKDFDVFLDLDANPEHKKYLKPVLNLSYNYYGWIDPFAIKNGVLYVRNDTATGWTQAKNARAILANIRSQGKPINQIQENFADGKVKGKSRPGRVKRAGASCNGSVTDLRAKAKKASGERARMYHWCANMKSGNKKK